MKHTFKKEVGTMHRMKISAGSGFNGKRHDCNSIKVTQYVALCTKFGIETAIELHLNKIMKTTGVLKQKDSSLNCDVTKAFMFKIQREQNCSFTHYLPTNPVY
jgi:hypothetical protein